MLSESPNANIVDECIKDGPHGTTKGIILIITDLLVLLQYWEPHERFSLMK